MTETMKALVLTEVGMFTYKNVTIPKAGKDEVLVRVKAVGICGSDVHGYDGSSGRRRPPLIIGHEAAGVIAAVGESVEGWEIGEPVTFDSTIYCGECFYCRKGMVNLCENRRVAGVDCGDYHQEGAMAEFIAVPARILYRLPEGLSFEKAAMVEGLSVAFHAVEMTPSLKLDDTVMVYGAGTIGLLTIQSLRLRGCGTIIAVDLDETKLEKAKELGADLSLNPLSDDVPGKVAALTGGLGADRAFECVGVSPTVNDAIANVRKGGSVTLVGNVSPKVEFPLQSVVTRQIQIYSSCASAGEYPACLNMINRGSIDVGSLISKTAPLCEGQVWFDRLHGAEKGLMKVILLPPDQGFDAGDKG